MDLDHWLKSLSSEEYAAYREITHTKRKNMSMRGGPDPKIRQTELQSLSPRNLQEGLGQESRLQTPETESSETTQGKFICLMGIRRKAVTPQTPAVGIKMEIVSLGTVDAAHLPQVTPLTQTATEFCGTENFPADIQGIHVKWKSSSPCPCSFPSFLCTFNS